MVDRGHFIFDATIFSFFLDGIVGLPFDGNSMKVGVSTHIGTNGKGKIESSRQADESQKECLISTTSTRSDKYDTRGHTGCFCRRPILQAIE